MGHHSASCAITGLGIYGGQKAVLVSLVGKLEVYDYWGNTYSMVQGIRELSKARKTNKDTKEMYDSFLVDEEDTSRKSKLLKVRDLFSHEVKTPFVIYHGEYSGYGDLVDVETDRSNPYMFFHPKVWEFCQEHWASKKVVKSEFQTQDEFEFENVCGLALWLRIQLSWGSSHLGCQDPEKDEFELREKFLTLLQNINNQQHKYYSQGD